MTSLTVHLEEALLKRTLELAEARQASVDDLVADALKEASSRWTAKADAGEASEVRRERIAAALAKFSNFDTGGPYTRDELNER